jgi:flagellar assembly protein FliH
MSSRARRVDRESPVESYLWTMSGGPADEPPLYLDLSLATRGSMALQPQEHEGLPRPGLRAEAAATVVALADQQAHLAALEREAFTKGYAQGERAGIEAGGKRAEAMLRRVAQTLDELAKLRRTMIRETERQTVELALTLARRVVTRELSIEPDLVAALAHVALERLGESSPATIRLNPDDYSTVAAHRGDQWEGTLVSIVPDPAVARGGCLVESDFGVIDGSIEAQFEELTRALLGDRRPDEAPALGAGDE